MIPSPFDYARATTVKEAVALLSGREDAQILAGGHSLIPALKLRLHDPSLLIDVSGVHELSRISVDGDHLRIGALATHRQVEMSDLVRRSCAALSKAAGGIGDPQVRNKGTIGGSLAHADPAADYPALMLALGATIHVAGPSGARAIAADDFFVGIFETALAAGEIITGVAAPRLASGEGAAYAKFAHAASKYAVVGVAARVSVSESGHCRDVRIGVTGAAGVAFRASQAEEALRGGSLDHASIKAAASGMVDPQDLMSDHSASAEYRAHLCSVLTFRAITAAVEDAGGA